jgi:hypothetical protein
MTSDQFASSAAWAVSRELGKRLAAPLDFGLELADGKRLFGSHKTWRGLAGGILACALVAPLVGLGAATGAASGALALLDDALSSAVKRRLALPPGVEALVSISCRKRCCRSWFLPRRSASARSTSRSSRSCSCCSISS